MVSSLDSFKDVVSEFRKLLLLAVGGSSLLPVLGKVAGFEPIWPNGIVIVTALATLVVLIFSFQFYWKCSRKLVQNRLKIGLLICIIFFLLYFSLHSFFVFKIPTNSELIYVGCGWTPEAKLLASEYLADPNSGCPGQYLKMLESVKYDAEILWNFSSLGMIRISMVITWILMFCSLSYVIAIFVVYHTNSKTHKK